MFTETQLRKLRSMGSAGLTTKLAQHDGYTVEEDASPEKQVASIFGQKYFTKKASMKNISKGLAAMQKLGSIPKTASKVDYSWDSNPTADVYASVDGGGDIHAAEIGELDYNYSTPDLSKETLKDLSQLSKDIRRKKDIDPWFRAEQGLAKNLGITGLLAGGLYGADSISQHFGGPDLSALKEAAPAALGIGGLVSALSYGGDKLDASDFNNSQGYKIVADQLRDVPKEVKSLREKNQGKIEAAGGDIEVGNLAGNINNVYFKDMLGSNANLVEAEDMRHIKALGFDTDAPKKKQKK